MASGPTFGSTWGRCIDVDIMVFADVEALFKIVPTQLIYRYAHNERLKTRSSLERGSIMTMEGYKKCHRYFSINTSNRAYIAPSSAVSPNDASQSYSRP